MKILKYSKKYENTQTFIQTRKISKYSLKHENINLKHEKYSLNHEKY